MSTRIQEGANDWAVVVGIDRYPSLGDLSGPENDARAFRDWLVAPDGGGLPGEQVALILSSSGTDASTARPTVEIIQEAFDQLVGVAEANGMLAGRRLYIFLAGHGFEPESEEPALFAADATRARADRHVAGRSFADWFRRAGLFDEVLLFMDCCREPAVNVPLRPVPYGTMIAADAPEIGRWMNGFATKWSRRSREKRFEEGVRGVFTAALLAGLSGAAAAEDGQITDESLADYLYAHMRDLLSPEELADPDIPKKPDIQYDTDPANRIVIARVAPGAAPGAEDPAPRTQGRSGGVVLDVRPSDPAAEIVVEDGSLSVVARGAGPLRAELPAGIYGVSARAAGRRAERMVKLLSGSAPVVVTFDELSIRSPAPIAGARSPEAHQLAAAAESRRVHATLGEGSEIFVFARAPSVTAGPGEAEAALDMAGLTLAGADGRTRLSLAAGVSGRGGGAFHACNVAVDPGVYRLQRRIGGGHLCRTVVAPAGFQTQVFLELRPGEPPERMLGTASIFHVRCGAGFDPESAALRDTELARIALEERGPPLSDERMSALLAGHMEHPMLGLFAAHLLLRAGKKDSPSFEALSKALRRALGPHPDADALSLALGELEAQPCSAPPMLRASLSLVVEASHARPSLVPFGSPAARAASRLWRSEPWLVWEEPETVSVPLPPPASLEQTFEALKNANRARLLTQPDLTGAEVSAIEEMHPTPGRAVQLRPDRARYARERTPPANPLDLARRLALPPASLHEILWHLTGPGSPTFRDTYSTQSVSRPADSAPVLAKPAVTATGGSHAGLTALGAVFLLSAAGATGYLLTASGEDPGASSVAAPVEAFSGSPADTSVRPALPREASTRSMLTGIRFPPPKDASTPPIVTGTQSPPPQDASTPPVLGVHVPPPQDASTPPVLGVHVPPPRDASTPPVLGVHVPPPRDASAPPRPDGGNGPPPR